ncbi:hypothetical protein DMJ13_17575 [halophilic archaeon]|nr:hypothetical protein DMJ13_17575 [halophilic archaeon]
MERRQTHQIGDLDTILDTSHIESAHYIRKSGPYYSERTFYLVVNDNMLIIRLSQRASVSTLTTRRRRKPVT